MTGLPVFILLERYLKVAPIYKLAIGPRSIVVVSDAVAAKNILRSDIGMYDKGQPQTNIHLLESNLPENRW